MTHLPLQGKALDVLTAALSGKADLLKVPAAHPGPQGVDIEGPGVGNSGKGEGISPDPAAEVINPGRGQPGKPGGLMLCHQEAGGLFDTGDISHQGG